MEKFNLEALSSAFLPQLVFELEEYGLPRMIARKIHDAGFIDFNKTQLSLHQTLDILQNTGIKGLKQTVENLTQFDEFLLNYFIDGIRTRPSVRIT